MYFFQVASTFRRGVSFTLAAEVLEFWGPDRRRLKSDKPKGVGPAAVKLNWARLGPVPLGLPGSF